MTLSLPGALNKIMIGNDAGWLLTFYREKAGKVDTKDKVLEIGRDDYYAEIQASLPDGLEGGVYNFVIEGLTDDHYGKIARGQDNPPTVVRLFLYWRDTNASVTGFAKNLASLTDTMGNVKSEDIKDALVAELRITGVSRKAGSRRYETTIKARERVFDILARKRLPAALSADDPLKAAKTLATNPEYGVPVKDYKLTGTDQSQASENHGTDKRNLERGTTGVDALKCLERRMEQSTGKYGRGMYLIRDGTLHIGEREFAGEDDATPLTLRHGLIETEKLQPLVTDPNFDYRPNPDAKPLTREQYQLTLKGRPDIKPGHVVKFKPPEVEEKKTTAFGVIGSVATAFKPSNILPTLGEPELDEPTLLYVTTVQHKLGRTSGFVTTLSGVQIIDGESPWDTHTRAHRDNDDDEECRSTPATSEQRVARAVKKRISAAMASQRLPEVGEVREMTTNGKEEPPSQTLTVWSGLAPADGRTGQARRLAIERPSPAPADGVPYTSPFAWGKCGLVLPRYPGTRVLLSYRNGQRDDPVDVGALWESGHGPDSEPGDWWLILPVDIPANKRASIAGSATPTEHTGKATNDLIDADGNRVIEVGTLTVRIGTNSLDDAGKRPAQGSDDVGVTIEHADGNARILIKNDGTVAIEAAKNIELSAPSGDIEMTAQNVKVTVSGSMDVS